MGRPSLLNPPVCVSVCLSVCVCDWAGFGSLESGMGVAEKKDCSLENNELQHMTCYVNCNVLFANFPVHVALIPPATTVRVCVSECVCVTAGKAA